MLNRNVCRLAVFLLVVVAAFFSGLSPTQAATYAVCAGLTEYEYPQYNLNFCDADAQGVWAALGGSSLDGGALLTNSGASKAAILNAISSVSQVAVAGDTVVFFYSGHGGNKTDAFGNVLASYICPYGSNPYNWNDDISEDELEAALGNLPTQNVCVIIDACNSGGFIGKSTGGGAVKTYLKVGQVAASKKQLELAPAFKDLQKTGYVVLTASRESELSMEFPSNNPDTPDYSVFSYYVIQALSGSGDGNEDGSVSAEEVHAYAAPLAAAYNSGQNAQLYDGNGLAELILASVAGGGDDGGDGGGCFVATAAHGTPMAEEVMVLRKFRDQYLLPNEAGAVLVGFYYEYGPHLAEYISDGEKLKSFVRTGLRPLIWFSELVTED